MNRLALLIPAAALPLLPAAQSFDTQPQLNPFGIPVAVSHYKLAFGDLDNDGDQDALALNQSGNVPFLFFENEGGPESPEFNGNPVSNPFGLQQQDGITVIRLLDLDTDGDLDLFTGAANGFRYYENIGTVGAPEFNALESNPFGLAVPAGSTSLRPAFGDLNGDSLPDLLAADFNSNLFFYPNTGTAEAPAFGEPQAAPFNYQKPPGNPILMAPTLEDVDGDGLPDLLTGYNPGKIDLYHNSGTEAEPYFDAPQADPLGLNLSAFPTWCMPIFCDIDGDGDRDLFVTAFPDLYFYENLTPVNALSEAQPLRLSVFPNPATGLVHISLPDGRPLAGGARVLLMDMAGRVVTAVGSFPWQLSLHGLPASSYWLEARDGRQRYVATLLKVE
ncbi:MAG: T9SS type A sorting domain-containing protein [Phaeodactylibacter sp.]|nr:T9SS type A sorting domain-containing protein [Phaeodactylibacter sp.]